MILRRRRAASRAKALSHHPRPRPSLANWLKATRFRGRTGEAREVLGRDRRRVGKRRRFGTGPPMSRGPDGRDKSRRVLLRRRDSGTTASLASRSGLIRSMRVATVSGVRDVRRFGSATRGDVEDPGRAVAIAPSLAVCQDRLGDGVRGGASGDPFDRRSSRSSRALRVHERVGPCRPGRRWAGLRRGPCRVAGRRCRTRPSQGRIDVRCSSGRRGGLSWSGLTNASQRNQRRRGRISGMVRGRGATSGCTCSNGKREGSRRDKTDGVVIDDDVQTAPPFTTGTPPAFVPARSRRIDRLWAPKAHAPNPAGGKAAPDFVPVVESGIRYLVNLGDSFSAPHLP
ncbi:hypothetical protein ACHAW5_000209 [Stephanodiscus triporus]|uniref:Uncharacterized protein n=1 Tax=Stephanodiscus triporus TaxID=2934178 RepID=A0ABD3MIS8_9STRA